MRRSAVAKGSGRRTQIERRAVAVLVLLSGVVWSCDNPSEPKPSNPLDALSPTISITSPERGAMLVSGTYESSSVVVTGQACHESQPITSLTVNGSAVPVTGDQMCEPFSVTIDSPWGMTGFTVVATNKLGRETTHAQSFLRSPSYYPALLTPDVSARISPGAYVRFTPPGLQKMTSLVGGQNPAFVLGTTLPNPLANTEPTHPVCIAGDRSVRATGYLIQHGAVSRTRQTVSISVPSDQRLRFNVSYPVSMPVTITGYNKTSCDPVVTSTATGSVTAAIVADVDLIFGIDPTVGGITTSMNFNNGSASSLNVNVNLDAMTFLSDATKSAIIATIASQFESNLGAELAPIVNQIYAAEFAKIPSSVSVPARNLSEIGLDLIAPAGSFRFNASGMTLGFGTQVLPHVARVGSAPAQGSIRTDVAATSNADPADDVAFEVNDDFLNRIFWAAWQGGLFDSSDLTSITGAVPGLSLSMRSLLPPVLTRPTTAGIRLSWGDARITALIDPVTFRVAGETSTTPVTAEANATVVLDGTLDYDSLSGRMRLTGVTTTATVHVDHVSTVKLNDAAVRTAITDAFEEAGVEMLTRVVRATPIAETVLPVFLGGPAGWKLPAWRSGVVRFADYEYVMGSIGSQTPRPPRD